jgi:hypothetical protein
MDDVDTRFNREPRNKGFSDEEAHVLLFLGMELILLLRVNLYLRKVTLIKWCGLCSTIAVKLRIMWTTF